MSKSKKKDSDRRMVYRVTLKREFGLTDRFIRMLGEPDKRVCNAHYRSGPGATLYYVDRIERFIAEHAEEIASAKKNRRTPEEMEEARRAKFLKKFPDRNAALPAAAEVMFNLNRYAKWKTCQKAHRSEIYEIKNLFVRMLYEMGLAEHVYLHQSKREGKPCRNCRGPGQASGRPDWDEDMCWKCGGSGWYLEPDTLEFVCFKFRIKDKFYCWHQPREMVAFEYELTDDSPPADWTPEYEKPLKMSSRKFAEGKALLRFVLELGGNHTNPQHGRP